MLSLLALSLGATAALAQGTKGGDGHVGGSFEDGGDTLVSGMMLFLGNENKVYILDKSENNAAQINGHPAMGSVWDMNTRKSEVLEVRSNPFCASGMHMPNGSYITFGGNGAIGPGGNVGDTNNGAFDTVFGDLAGQTGVRVMNPLDCTGDDAATKAECQWYDDPSVTHLKAMRWYSTAEPQADGSVVIIGGYSNGGYINRNYPDGNDPVWQGGASQPTYEFWPPIDATPPVMPILVEAGGLNSYPHTHLMRSGRMLMQVNVSTILFDPATGDEKRLPPMPENIVRVYPASGAVTMLPMTPANNYSQTVLYCGGSDLPDDAWGNYSWPFVNTWEYPASKKCHSLEAEPLDGSDPAYVEEDPMPEGRTMGQFINLPDGTILMVNGGLNGTAGYSEMTLQTTSYSQMPYGMSLASGPVGRPAIYDPRKPKGQRWITEGLATSDVARLYHSSAILLPDASVLIAGGNPNVDVNLTTVFPTTYKAEIFYPPYFSAPQRPKPEGVPKTISYGGDAFDIKIPASGYSGSANDAADNATVVLIRPGFTTHAMNMGQRHLQLENTYTVQDDGTIVLHVAQAPPVPELFQPGPALLFVTVNGIPSNGTLVTVGTGQIGKQPIGAIAQLPASQRSTSAPQGSGSSGSGSNDSGSGDKSNAASHTGPIIGGIIAAIALVGILGAVFGICITRRRRAASQLTAGPSYPMGAASGAGGVGGILPGRGVRNSDSSAFVPLQQDNSSGAWNANASQLSLNSPFSPYHDEHHGGDGEFDPYRQNSPRMPSTPGRY